MAKIYITSDNTSLNEEIQHAELTNRNYNGRNWGSLTNSSVLQTQITGLLNLLDSVKAEFLQIPIYMVAHWALWHIP